jgi:hypothetical protein
MFLTPGFFAVAVDVNPDAFSFTSQSGTFGTHTCNPVTLTGMSPNTLVTLSAAVVAGIATSPQVAAGPSALGSYGASITATTSGTGTLLCACQCFMPSSGTSQIMVTVGTTIGIFFLM